MRLLPLVLLPVALLLVAADGDAGDQAKIQGTWKVVQATKRGKEAPAEAVKDLTVTFKDSTVTIGAGAAKEEAGFKLDPSKKPGAIDITPPGKADRAVQGIYELKGDDLKLCWRKGGEERPAKFESTEDNGVSLLVLKRDKK